MKSRFLFILEIIAIFIVAFNLRSGLATVAPVLDRIISKYDLTILGAAFLNSAPILCLGASAPIIGLLLRRWSPHKIILWSLLLLSVSSFARAYTGVFGLLSLTVLCGLFMGVIGIILPGVIKSRFGEEAIVVMGLYTAALSFGGAVAAGLTEPLRIIFDGTWEPAVAIWAAPVLVGAIMWYGIGNRFDYSVNVSPRGMLWSNRLAWCVTGYMGLQSALAYSVFSWLPLILIESGRSAFVSGWALGVAIGIQVLSAIAAPILVRTNVSCQKIIVILMLMIIFGLMIVIYYPDKFMWIGVILIGVGQGGTFSLALSLITIKAGDLPSTNALSAMTQGIGYIAAAIGPFVIGAVRFLGGSWHATGPWLATIGLAALLCGAYATRNRSGVVFIDSVQKYN